MAKKEPLEVLRSTGRLMRALGRMLQVTANDVKSMADPPELVPLANALDATAENLRLVVASITRVIDRFEVMDEAKRESRQSNHPDADPE